jgi:hypothetical protein
MRYYINLKVYLYNKTVTNYSKKYKKIIKTSLSIDYFKLWYTE